MHLAGGKQPLIDFADQMALDQRPMLVEQEIVGFRPVAATDSVDVAGAAGDDQPGLGALALNQGVDRDGRAMDQFIDRRCIKPALADAVDDAAGRAAPASSGSWPRRSGLPRSSKPIRSVKVPPISIATTIMQQSTSFERFRDGIWWDHRATTPVARCQAAGRTGHCACGRSGARRRPGSLARIALRSARATISQEINTQGKRL